MKKTIKKVIKSLILSSVTLAAGFLITAVTFNLFDSLTTGEMKILFAVDVIIMIIGAAISCCIFENKKEKERKQRQFEKRHMQRVEKSFRELDGIDMVEIASKSSHYAA